MPRIGAHEEPQGALAIGAAAEAQVGRRQLMQGERAEVFPQLQVGVGDAGVVVTWLATGDDIAASGDVGMRKMEVW